MFPRLLRDSFGEGSGAGGRRRCTTLRICLLVAIIACLASEGWAVVKLLPRKVDNYFEDKEDGVGVWSLSSLSVSSRPPRRDNHPFGGIRCAANLASSLVLPRDEESLRCW